MKMRRIVAILLILVLALSVLSALAEDTVTFEPIPWDAKKPSCKPKEENYLPDNGGYHDSSIDVRIETFRRYDTTVMAAYVTIADPSQLRTAMAGKYPSKQTKNVYDFEKDLGAVLAINGDYFSYHSQGIVYRNGVQYRMRPHTGRDTLIIDSNGDFTILQPTTQAAFDAFEGEVIHTFCFGPALVIDGVPLTDFETVKLDCGPRGHFQRIAIGQTGPLSYLILTCEGPENTDAVGFDLLQMAALCKEMGMINAYNLDGGSSCHIALHNKKLNALSSKKIRSVGDCIYFATLEK